jgi:hypothetical protein
VPLVRPEVGQAVRSIRDLILVGNLHVIRLTHGPAVLPKGSEAEITAITQDGYIELNCKDGPGRGRAAWGLRIRVAKHIFGFTFV